MSENDNWVQGIPLWISIIAITCGLYSSNWVQIIGGLLAFITFFLFYSVFPICLKVKLAALKKAGGEVKGNE